MLSAIGNLEQALPGLPGLRSAGSRGIDWHQVRRALGTDLPADYKALCEAYPSFSVEEFLLVPTIDPGRESEIGEEMTEALDVLRDLAENDMAHGYVPYPQPGGLLHCAETSLGDLFYWRTGDPDPNAWPVVVSTRNNDWWEYGNGLVSLLSGLISGQVPTRGLPDPFVGHDAEVRVL